MAPPILMPSRLAKRCTQPTPRGLWLERRCAGRQRRRRVPRVWWADRSRRCLDQRLVAGRPATLVGREPVLGGHVVRSPLVVAAGGSPGEIRMYARRKGTLSSLALARATTASPAKDADAAARDPPRIEPSNAGASRCSQRTEADAGNAILRMGRPIRHRVRPTRSVAGETPSVAPDRHCWSDRSDTRSSPPCPSSARDRARSPIGPCRVSIARHPGTELSCR